MDLSSGAVVELGDAVERRMCAPPPAAPILPSRVILVVGADPALASGLSRGLERRGYALRVAADAESALAALRHDRPDGVVLDLGVDTAPRGALLLRQVRQIDAALPLIAVASPEGGRGASIAEVIAAGAFVLARPLEPEAVHAAFERAMAELRQAGVLAYYRKREAQRAGLERLLGESIPMLRLKTQLRLLLDAEAQCRDAPAVILHGDSGTGKGEVARALHFDGARRERPFVRVDIEDLVAPEAEARLFGNERGALPGANERRLGLVDAADGGTLFISDLAAMTPPLQRRFMRLLEHGALQRVGSTREVPVDVRVVAATRCRPEALLHAGRLRPELHRRLAAAPPLQLPPLRERGDDMWLLTHRFVQGTAERHGLPPPCVSAAARALLARHPWPGNVRELRHALERAVLLQPDGTIDSAHLAFGPAPRPMLPPPPPELNLHRLEREALTQALERAYGNVSRAARLLGISRDTMRYRIARHALAGTRTAR